MASPLDAVRRLAAAAFNLLLARAEFASLELAQARAQIVRWFAFALGAMMMMLLALIAASALFVVVLWPRLDWMALLLLGLAYAAGAVLLMRRLQREMKEAPPLLAETLRELARDRGAFTGRGPGAVEPHHAGAPGEAP